MEILPKEEWEDCPNCPNQGWYVGGNPRTGPEQIQCQFCYERPASVFNQESLIEQQQEES